MCHAFVESSCFGVYKFAFLIFLNFFAPIYPIEDLKPPFNWYIILDTFPLYSTLPSTPSGTNLDLSLKFFENIY